jgi:hypothetical protein
MPSQLGAWSLVIGRKNTEIAELAFVSGQSALPIIRGFQVLPSDRGRVWWVFETQRLTGNISARSSFVR